MSKEMEFFGLLDRQKDKETLTEMIRITNIGIEAVTKMYDDHRRDTMVQERLFLMQENVVYRLFAVLTQYEILVDGIKKRAYLDDSLNPFPGPKEMHPTIYKYSCELGSMVDSVFFHLCSSFDYLGHYVSYILNEGKGKTTDWHSTANIARAKWKESSNVGRLIDLIDAQLLKKLEEHRSKLIHRSRDSYMVGSFREPDTNLLRLTFASSDDTMKRFRKLLPGLEGVVPGYQKEAKYTLDFLCSMVIYQSFHYVNHIFKCLRADLWNDSTFKENLENPKLSTEHPYEVQLRMLGKTPRSEKIWSDYHKQHEVFIEALNKRWDNLKPGKLDI